MSDTAFHISVDGKLFAGMTLRQRKKGVTLELHYYSFDELPERPVKFRTKESAEGIATFLRSIGSECEVVEVVLA